MCTWDVYVISIMRVCARAQDWACNLNRGFLVLVATYTPHVLRTGTDDVLKSMMLFLITTKLCANKA